MQKCCKVNDYSKKIAEFLKKPNINLEKLKKTLKISKKRRNTQIVKKL